MKLKPAKIIFFVILLTCFGWDQVSEALKYSNSIYKYSETNDLITKEGGGGKKGGGKKSAGKKGGGKKSAGKKSGGKKVLEKNKNSLNKVQSNNEDMKEKAKERYKKWKESKKIKKSNVDLESNQ